MFNKNSVLKNFAKNHRKTSALKSLYNIDKARNFIKKGLQNMCFPLNFTKSLTISFLKNTPRHCFCVGCIFNKYFAFEGLFRLIEPLLDTQVFNRNIQKCTVKCEYPVNTNIQNINPIQNFKSIKKHKTTDIQKFKYSKMYNPVSEVGTGGINK